MAYYRLSPWDGDKCTLYRCIAAAIGCHPYTVRRWHRSGPLRDAILSYLEEDNAARYASRTGRRPATPHQP